MSVPKTPRAVVPMAIPIAAPRSSSSGYAAASMAKPTVIIVPDEMLFKKCRDGSTM